jgi:hypothetical protein
VERLEEVSAVLLEQGLGLPSQSTFRYRRGRPYLLGDRYVDVYPPRGIWTRPCDGIGEALIAKERTRATLPEAVEHYSSNFNVHSVAIEYSR